MKDLSSQIPTFKTIILQSFGKVFFINQCTWKLDWVSGRTPIILEQDKCEVI